MKKLIPMAIIVVFGLTACKKQGADCVIGKWQSMSTENGLNITNILEYKEDGTGYEKVFYTPSLCDNSGMADIYTTFSEYTVGNGKIITPYGKTTTSLCGEPIEDNWAAYITEEVSFSCSGNTLTITRVKAADGTDVNRTYTFTRQ